MVAPVCTGYSGADIYHLVNANPNGARDLGTAGDELGQAGSTYTQTTDRIVKAQGMLAEVWGGSGADSANSSLTALAKSTGSMGTALQQAQSSVGAQVDAFGQVKAQATQIAASRPDDGGMWNSITPWDTDAEASAHQWDSANKNNIAAYETYTSSTSPNSGQLPPAYQETAPNQLNGLQIGGFTNLAGVGGAPPPDSGTTRPTGGNPLSPKVTAAAGPNQPTASTGFTPTPGTLPTAGGPVAPVAGPGGNPSGNTGAGPVGAPGETSASTYLPPTATTPGLPGSTETGRPGIANPGTANPANPYNGATGFTPLGGRVGSIGDGNPVSGRGSTGAPGGGNSGSNSGNSSGRNGNGLVGNRGGTGDPEGLRSGNRVGGAPGDPEGLRSGNRVGGGPGAGAASEGVAGRGGVNSSTSGRGGAGVNAGMGAPGSKKDEDEEHERKFVLPLEDPDDLFAGDLPPTPPPVIGA